MKNLIFILLLLLSVSVSAQRNKLKNITEKNGKIGIGTTQPDELLTVKGKVHAQEVIVDLNGAIAPDYVFESYYEGVSKINSSYHFLTLRDKYSVPEWFEAISKQQVIASLNRTTTHITMPPNRSHTEAGLAPRRKIRRTTRLSHYSNS